MAGLNLGLGAGANRGVGVNCPTPTSCAEVRMKPFDVLFSTSTVLAVLTIHVLINVLWVFMGIIEPFLKLSVRHDLLFPRIVPVAGKIWPTHVGVKIGVGVDERRR